MPVTSVGIKSGVNWMRLNVRPSAFASVRTSKRLGRARHARDQAVAADEQRHQQMLDDVVLADDDLANFRADLPEGRLEILDQRPRFLRSRACCLRRSTYDLQ